MRANCSTGGNNEKCKRSNLLNLDLQLHSLKSAVFFGIARMQNSENLIHKEMNMPILSKIKLFVLFLFSLMGLLFVTASSASLPLPPRFSANASASDYVVGQADLMLPMSGNESHNLYLDPNLGYGSDSQGYADLGLGYRWIQNDAAILGAYLFGGYSRIDNNARIWVANPGIEALGSRWDAHLNGYLVMGDRHDTLGHSSRFAYFTGHSQINNLFNNVQYAGNGADVGVAYQVFPETPFKVFAGGYFFNPSQGNIGGGLAGLEYWFDSYLKVFAAYSYDNVRHSTGALGLGIEFGGTHVHRSDPDLEERMTDPVQRYLAELGHGSKIPSRTVYNQFSRQAAVLNNIAFFSQSGGPNNGGLGLTIANCTFENPCGPTDLTDAGAATLSALLPNTLMYFNGGSYNALNVPGGTLAVNLQPGQTIESRTADYSQLATGAARSTFNGAFILPGNNTIENIILLPTAATASSAGGLGISSTGGSNLLITGSQIGSATAANHFRFGIDLVNTTNALIQDTNISASSNSFNDAVIGVQTNNSSATLQNVNISLFSNTDATQVNPILVENGSSVVISNSNLAIMNTGANALNNSDIFIENNNNMVTVMDSTLIATAGTPDSVNGIYVFTSGSVGNVVNVSNSQINVTNTAAGGAANAFNNSGTSSNSITFNNGTLAATATSPAIANGPSITINGSVCYLNGGQVVCP
jgi:hypothetical protein